MGGRACPVWRVRTEVEVEPVPSSTNGQTFTGGVFTSYGDHRIAMSIAAGATRAAAPVEIDDTGCDAK